MKNKSRKLLDENIPEINFFKRGLKSLKHLMEAKGTSVKLYKDGSVVTKIEEGDEPFYKTDNYFAESIKFVYFLK